MQALIEPTSLLIFQGLKLLYLAMKHYLLYTLIGGICWLTSCYDENLIIPENQITIPDDTLAFYLIEGYHDNMDLSKITADSIKEFKKRIIGYGEIISYDTSAYIFELTSAGRENVDSLMLARYARHYPIAVISKGECLFGVYISHAAASSFPDWFSLEPYYVLSYPNNYLVFSIPTFTDKTIETDLRVDERMLQILASGNKLK